MTEQERIVKVAENVRLLVEVVQELLNTMKQINDRVYQLEQWAVTQGMRQ